MYSIEYYNGAIWQALESANMDGVSVVKKRDEGQIFTRTEISGSVKFYGADYDTLYNATGLKLQAQIKRNSTVIASGYIDLLGTWDEAVSVCELSFIVVDGYNDILKKYDEDIILKKGTTTINLEIQSTPKYLQLSNIEYPEPPSDEGNWLLYESDENYWYYVKQVINFPHTGWDYDPDINYGEAFPSHFGWSYASETIVTVEKEFDRFKTLTDILNELCTAIDISFDVNDYGTYLDLSYMIGRADQVYNNDAPLSLTLFETNLSEILDDIKALFNLDWYIDDDDKLKFKHPSETVKTLPLFGWPAHDLTFFQGGGWVANIGEYSYKSDLPNKELWKVNKSDQADFDGLPIRYDNDLESSIESDLGKYYNNVYSLLRKDTPLEVGEIDDDHITIIATDSGQNILIDTGIISGESLINEKLTISRLQDDHFKNGGRYFDSGIMNGITQSFTNVRPIKEIVDIKVPATIDAYNFDYLVKTELGNAELISVSEPLDGDYATLKMLLVDDYTPALDGIIGEYYYVISSDGAYVLTDEREYVITTES